MAKLIEVSQITPFTDDSSEYSFVSEFSLPLTFFDLYWFKFPPVERLFFYSLPEPKETLLNSVIPKLKRSLSLTLCHFLPLAGTLTWPRSSPKPVILYEAPNDAVSLTIAQYSKPDDFEILCSDEQREASWFRCLVPDLGVSENGASVVSLQITIFPERGFCIGVTTHHAILDGKSTMSFVKSWAHMCREIDSDPKLPSELSPDFDRSEVKDPKGLEMLYLNQWLEFSGSKFTDPRDDPKLFEHLPIMDLAPDLIRATFQFSRSDIAKVRQHISSPSFSPEARLSTFVVAFSYSILCMVRATAGSENKVLFGFTADLRRRMRHPVPENYLGNCVAGIICRDNLRTMMATAEGRELAAVAERLGGLVAKLNCGEDVIEGAEEWLTNFLSIGSAHCIGVAGSPRFGVYDVDFGWGMPRKMEVASIDRTGAVSMAETRDGSGGVELGVALRKPAMAVFASVFAEGLK